MNKAILISIKPKYVADILNGKKTIEIRKTMPKCDLPITVYIYCTKDNDRFVWQNENMRCEEYMNGKVVAKFTVRKVEELRPFFHWCEELEKATCLTYDEVLIVDPETEISRKEYELKK